MPDLQPVWAQFRVLFRIVSVSQGQHHKPRHGQIMRASLTQVLISVPGCAGQMEQSIIILSCACAVSCLIEVRGIGSWCFSEAFGFLLFSASS